MAPQRFTEARLAKSMGILWGEWINQPAAHRALYLAVEGYEREMDEIDEDERKVNQAKEDRLGRQA